MTVKWLEKSCEYCGQQLNSWDDRIGKTLCFNFPICERCIAEEYGMTVEYLRTTMERRFGVHPCEGI